jgi:hypothetical protein
MDRLQELVSLLRTLDVDDRAGVKEELCALLRGPHGREVRDYLEKCVKNEVLELRWEIEEVLETVHPKPAPRAPEPPPKPVEEPAPTRRIKPSDLVLVYDDPRGLMVHTTRDGARWFATQVDPRTRKPQTFELHPEEIEGLRAQLANSPHWVSDDLVEPQAP